MSNPDTPTETSSVMYTKSDYIKIELLQMRSKANQFLKRFRMLSGTSPFDIQRKEETFRSFVSEMVSLYLLIRANLLKNVHEKEELKQIKEMDEAIIEIDYSNKKLWTKRWFLLDTILYQLGLTSVEIDRSLIEEEME